MLSSSTSKSRSVAPSVPEEFSSGDMLGGYRVRIPAVDSGTFLLERHDTNPDLGGCAMHGRRHRRTLGGVHALMYEDYAILHRSSAPAVSVFSPHYLETHWRDAVKHCMPHALWECEYDSEGDFQHCDPDMYRAVCDVKRWTVHIHLVVNQVGELLHLPPNPTYPGLVGDVWAWALLHNLDSGAEVDLDVMSTDVCWSYSKRAIPAPRSTLMS